MDNLRKHRRSSDRSFDTDGFIKSSRPKVGGGQDFKSRDAGHSERRRVGNFKSAEGFHNLDRPEADVPRRSPERDESGKVKLSTPVSEAEQPEEKTSILRRLNPFRPSNWSRRKAAVSFAVMLLVVGGWFGGKAWMRFQQIFAGGSGGAVALQEEVDPDLLRGEGDGRINILVLGRGGEGHEGPDLTDTIVVASINVIQKEAALLSIPRDLYVETSSGSSAKINAVFAFAKESALSSSGNSTDKKQIEKAEEAGFKAVEDVIKSKIGIPIHYHGIIDFAGFEKAVDTVGGVDINVPETGVVYDPLRLMGRDYILDVEEGPQHFDGLRALAYARSRYASPRGDFDRAERQRLLLTGLKTKVLSASTYSNPLKVSQLIDDFASHIRTNLSLDEVMRLYEIGQDFDNDAVTSVGLADPPNVLVGTDFVNGQSVVVPKAGLDNYSEIQHFVRNRLRDGFLAKEDAKIMILNGTTIPGLAARTADNLKSFGYNVVGADDAPTRGYHSTLVVDLTAGDKKYTRRYLENRFIIGAREQLPDPRIEADGADFVIILGQNEQIRLTNL